MRSACTPHSPLTVAGSASDLPEWSGALRSRYRCDLPDRTADRRSGLLRRATKCNAAVRAPAYVRRALCVAGTCQHRKASWCNNPILDGIHDVRRPDSLNGHRLKPGTMDQMTIVTARASPSPRPLAGLATMNPPFATWWQQEEASIPRSMHDAAETTLLSHYTEKTRRQISIRDRKE